MKWKGEHQVKKFCTGKDFVQPVSDSASDSLLKREKVKGALMLRLENNTIPCNHLFPLSPAKTASLLVAHDKVVFWPRFGRKGKCLVHVRTQTQVVAAKCEEKAYYCLIANYEYSELHNNIATTQELKLHSSLFRDLSIRGSSIGN